MGRPKNIKRKIDPVLDDTLGRIERAWREAGHDNLAGLVSAKADGDKPPTKGLVASSTWFGWRNGSRSPKFVEVLDVARAVGLSVRPLGQDGDPQLPRGIQLTTEMRQLLTMMQRLPKQLQQDILDFAERHERAWASPNPTKADAAE